MRLLHYMVSVTLIILVMLSANVAAISVNRNVTPSLITWNLQYLRTIHKLYFDQDPYGKVEMYATVYRIAGNNNPDYEYFFYVVTINYVPGTARYGSLWRLDYAWSKFVFDPAGSNLNWFRDRAPDYQAGATAYWDLYYYPPYAPPGWAYWTYIVPKPYIVWIDRSNMPTVVWYDHDFDVASNYAKQSFTAEPGYVVEAHVFPGSITACALVDGKLNTRFTLWWYFPWESYETGWITKFLTTCYTK